jgi:hypothetical protein
MRTDSRDFHRLIDNVRDDRGADFSVCDVQVPARVPRGMEPPRERRPWWSIIPFVD